MTPKHAAKSLVKFEKKHPAIETSSFVIEQVPGTVPRSTPVDGVAEALLKSKKYVVPITLAQPFATLGLALVYVGGGGRFHPNPHATVFDATKDAVPGIPSETKAVGSGADSTVVGVSFLGNATEGASYRALPLAHGRE